MALTKSLNITGRLILRTNAGEIVLNQSEEKTFPNTYIKVTSANLTKDTLVATVTTYQEKDGPVLEELAVTLPYDILSGVNAIAQAYNALKQLPEFAGAEDA